MHALYIPLYFVYVEITREHKHVLIQYMVLIKQHLLVWFVFFFVAKSRAKSKQLLVEKAH